MTIRECLRLSMKILGIDTTGKEAVIYIKNKSIVDFVKLNKQMKVSENLLSYIDELLTNNNLELKDIDVLACCIGPGSFTGIRIGIATCKAFMMANSALRCVTYNTFEPYLGLVNNGFIYSSCTKSSFYRCEIVDGNIKAIDVVEKTNVKYNDNSYLIGEDESVAYENKLDFDVLNHIKLVEENVKMKKFVTENEVTPNYVCDSQAERNLKNAK